MNREPCRWCGGRGCLQCDATRARRMQREVELEEAREVLVRINRKLTYGLPAPVNLLLDVAAECIAHGRELALLEVREEREVARLDRFGMLEFGEDVRTG